MHTLKIVLLGISVLVIEAYISQYSVCFDSPWNNQTQLLEYTCFPLCIKPQIQLPDLREHTAEQSERRSLFVIQADIYSYLLNA